MWQIRGAGCPEGSGSNYVPLSTCPHWLSFAVEREIPEGRSCQSAASHRGVGVAVTIALATLDLITVRSCPGKASRSSPLRPERWRQEGRREKVITGELLHSLHQVALGSEG